MPAAPAAPSRRRWRRVFVMGVPVVLALGVATGMWLLRDVPLPRPADVVPDGGEWLAFDAPRGLLDEELAEALTASYRHLTSDGGPLDGHALWADRDGTLPLLLRSRPWRVVVWRRAGQGTLVCFFSGGLGHVLRLGAPARTRRTRIAGRPVWVATEGTAVLLATREELIAGTRARIAAATLEWMVAGDGLRFEARLSGGPLGQDLAAILELPPTTNTISGRLRPVAGERWSLDIVLEGAWDPTMALPGEPLVPGLWKLLEEENVTVDSAAPIETRDGTVAARWRLAGVGRALLQIAEEMRFWSADADPPPTAAQR